MVRKMDGRGTCGPAVVVGIRKLLARTMAPSTSPVGRAVADPPMQRHLPVLLPVVITAVALVFTHLGLREHEISERDATFAAQAIRLHERLGERVHTYDQVLRGAAGLFASSQDVTRSEWHHYVSALWLDEANVGVQGLGFAERILPSGLEGHVARVRAEGFPDYAVSPSGGRDVYSAIVYLEPFYGRNLRAFGFDMLSESVRREAMMRACDQADIVYSGRVKLMQETGRDVQAGILAYMPVYAPGYKPQTVEQRRKALTGWVYLPLRMKDWLGAVLQDDVQRVRVQVVDLGPEGLSTPVTLFDSGAGVQTQADAADGPAPVRLGLSVHGRQWALSYLPVAGVWPLGGAQVHWLSLGGVALGGALLCALTWSLANTRTRARLMARELADEVAQGEERFRLMVESLRDYAVFMLDPQGFVISWNEGAERIKGWTPQEAIGRHFSCFYTEADRERGWPEQVLARALMHGRCVDEGWRVRKDGTAFRASVLFTAMRDDAGQIRGFAKFTRDVTERHVQEERLRLAATVFRTTQQGVAVTDPQGRVLTVNPAFESITEYLEAEVQGQDLRLLSSGRHEPAFFAAMWADLTATGAWQGEIWNRRKGGEVHASWLVISSVRDEQQKVANFVAVYTDITRIPHAETQMERLAHHDALTQLPNRLLLGIRMSHALERAKRGSTSCAVLYLDLDRFKPVNDELGHEAGDELLKEVAQRLRSHLRENDTVARIGGDEFVVVLEDLTGAEGGAWVARAIVERMQQPFVLMGQHHVHIGCSVGIALYPQHGLDGETLLRHADAALYEAKRAGRGAMRFFDPEAG